MNSSGRFHLSRVAALGCIVVFPDSGERCCSPAEIHHPRDGQGMGQRADHSQAIPLCFAHHSAQSPSQTDMLSIRAPRPLTLSMALRRSCWPERWNCFDYDALDWPAKPEKAQISDPPTIKNPSGIPKAKRAIPPSVCHGCAG